MNDLSKMNEQKPIGYLSIKGIERLKNGSGEIILDEVYRDYTQPVYFYGQLVPSQDSKELLEALEDALQFMRVAIDYEKTLTISFPEDIGAMEEKYKRYTSLLNTHRGVTK